MKNIQEVFQFLIGLSNQLVLFLIGLALVGFLWGIVRYIMNGANAEKRKEGSKFMVYGLISLLVITSLWGFVVLLQNTFGIGAIRGVDDPLGPDNPGGFDIKDPNLTPPFQDVNDLFNNDNVQIPV